MISKNFHLITIPPLFAVTLFFILGIIWHTALTLFFMFFLLTLCYAFFVYQKQNTFPKQLVICSFFVLTGAWLHHKELRNYDEFYTFIDNKKCTVTGTVIDKCKATVNHQKTILITLTIDTITTDLCTKKYNKTLLLYGKNNNSIDVGDTITLLDISIKKPSNKDFQLYQIKEQIVATLFINDAHYRVDYHSPWSIRYWIWNEKIRLLNALENKLSQHGFQFFSSLFLGNRAYVKSSLEETNELFKIWGIYHFLARSGMHLALFIFIWQAIFCLIPMPLTIKQIILSLFSCIYFVLTWTSTPFSRSFALFLLNKICLFSKTTFHTLHYLTLVCFIFLLYCPLYLFFLDFQLSFGLTFALAWFNQVTIQHRSQLSKY